MNSHLRPYNRCISNISTNIYLGLDFYLKFIFSIHVHHFTLPFLHHYSSIHHFAHHFIKIL